MMMICVGEIALVISLGLDHVSDKLSDVMTTYDYDCDSDYIRHVRRPIFT
jgi:hypothetical protein